MTGTKVDLSHWLEDARARLPEAVALRRKIHRHPELGLHLPETTRAVREALAGLDVEIQEGPSTSGLMVTLRGGRQGPTILLRGDMDALPMPEDTDLDFKSEVPGRMHACGHDSHVAMLVTAAHMMHARRDRLAGTVKFMFQPGEEGYFGARHMILDGLLDAAPAPQAAFALHISPNLPAGIIAGRPGAMMASADVIEIKVMGQGGHASMPHAARDPIPVACEIVQALQTYVTRRVNAFDPAVLTIAKIEAGSTNNVIPESAQLTGTLRTVSESTRAQVREGIRRVASKIAEAHEMTAEVSLEAGYDVTANDRDFTAFARGVVGDLLGPKGYTEMPAPVMGAEDFSYVLQKMPGCMMFLGVAPAGVHFAHAHSCHSNRMMLDEASMVNGIALHAAIAERWLAEREAA